MWLALFCLLIAFGMAAVVSSLWNFPGWVTLGMGLVWFVILWPFAGLVYHFVRKVRSW